MARINPAEVTRFPIPHEPGQWVELRRLSAGEMRRLGARKMDETGDRIIESLARQTTAWSYDQEPITVDALESLDGRTFAWLVDLAMRHSAGDLTDDEKKDATSRCIDSSTESARSMPTSSTGS